MNKNLTIYEIIQILLKKSPSTINFKKNEKIIYLLYSIISVLYLIFFFLFPKIKKIIGIIYISIGILLPIIVFGSLFIKSKILKKDYTIILRKKDIEFYENLLINNNMENNIDILLKYIDVITDAPYYYKIDILSIIISSMISIGINKVITDIIFSIMIFILVFIILKRTVKQ